MPWELLRLAEKGQIVLCLAPSMLDELNEVLTYKRLQPRLEQLGLLSSELVAYAMSLATIFEIQLPKGDSIVVADPDDDIFLYCAIIAKADYVVSGDNHLLDLGEYANIPIVTIRDFLAREFPALVKA